jgi:Tfp pilus assembly protein PilO
LWQIDAMGSAMVVLLAGVWYFGGLRPLTEARAARQGLESELAVQRDVSEKNSDILARQEQSLQKARQQNAASAIQLKKVDSVNQHVAELTSAAEGAGLRIDEIKQSQAVPGSRFTMVPIRLKGAGGYQAVSTFLRKLRAGFHDTGVTGFHLAKVEGAEKGDLKFSLDLVWYAEPPPAPAKK